MTDIIKSIDQGTVAPLYYLSGENVGRVEDVIERLKQKLFGGREDDFNLGLFDAQVHGPPDIIQTARTVPFGAARRLVVVKRAHAWKDSQWQSFEDYFSKPSAQSCLVFAAEKQVLKG
ncbi:MAG: hypothetical protein GY868_16015, partial [Deltaproteobacteria bacterium]|nr:hypothetical protein [Deltaproteobacteria bacterium]